MSNLIFCAKHGVASALSSFSIKKKGEDHSCLMYHSIYDEQKRDDLYSLSYEKFQEQMQCLISENRPIIPFSSNNAGVSVTFDDGHLDNYKLAAPFLTTHQIPFTIFMITDFVSPNHKEYLNKEHLRELASNPLVTIGGHGKTHRPLAQLSIAEAKEELKISKLELENIIGKEVTTMSFPHGSFNEELLSVAQEIGYKKCGTSIARNNPANDYQLQVSRHCVYSCETILSFKQKINGQWDWIVS